MKEYIRILYNRSLHRSFGNSQIGSASVFMTFIFLLRSAVNLYFFIDFSSGNAYMNISQICLGWFTHISVYIILCSSLSAFRVSYAIPEYSFLNFSAEGKTFKNSFLRRASLLRPTNILILALVVSGVFIFTSITSDISLLVRCLILLSAAIILSAILFRLARLIFPGKLEIQVLETCFLLLFVIINPDLYPYQNEIVMLYQGIYIGFDSILTLSLLLAAVFSGQVIMLLLLKAISVINRTFRGGIIKQPLIAWHLRFYNLNFWLLLYILIIPVLVVPVFDHSIKLRAAAIYSIFSTFAFLIFINHCDNSISERWQKRLLVKSNIRLVVKPLAVHFAVTILPVSIILFI